MNDIGEVPVCRAGKRCGLVWASWMGDWFVSWSPRNDNSNAEGNWYHWANLAAWILSHPFTQKTAPHLYRPDLVHVHVYTQQHAEGGSPLTHEEIGASVNAQEQASVHPEPSTTPRGQGTDAEAMSEGGKL